MFTISFLHTSLLFLTAATLLPLIVWLIARRKPQRIVFPSLRFIRLSEQEEKKRSKLKNILLLIIRMLIILLITLAVARPQLYYSRLKKSSKHPPTAIAIVLDTSFSMDYLHESKTLLDQGKDAIKRINSLAKAADKCILISLDESWNSLHAQTFAGSIPDELISSISVTHTPVSVGSALELAKTKLIESGLPNRELYLITDGDAGAYPASFDMDVFLIPLNKPQSLENLSLRDVQPLPQLVDKTRMQSLEFTLVNHGEQPRKDVLLRAVLGETKVAEKFVSIPARQELRENLLLELREDGWQTGYVEVVDERQLHDNRSYFAFPHRINPSIAVITSSASLPFYLEGALRVYSGATGKLKLINPNQLTLSELDNHQNFVIYKPGSMSPRLKELTEKLKAEERGALMILDEDLSAELKSWWASFFDCKFGSFERQGKDLGQLNPHHYISALLSGKDLAQKHISHYWSCKSSAAISLAGAGSDDLVLLKDRFVLFTFDPAASQNSFFIGPIFPVLSYRALEYSGLAQASGSKIKLRDLVKADRLSLPDGSKLELAGNMHRATMPGIYFSSVAGREETALAADYDYAESLSQPQDYSKLKYIKPLSNNWQGQIFRSRLGYDIWKILLAIALALFLLEIIIVRLSEHVSSTHSAELNPKATEV